MIIQTTTLTAIQTPTLTAIQTQTLLIIIHQIITELEDVHALEEDVVHQNIQEDLKEEFGLVQAIIEVTQEEA